MDMHPISPTSSPQATPYRHTPTPFTPSRSSPLTPKRQQNNSNSIDQLSFSSFSPISPPKTPPSPSKFTKKRKHKPIPIIRTKEDASERRRKLFMKKVTNGREEKRIELRGGEDEIMRMVLVSENRRWVNQLAKIARSLEIPTIEEETELELVQGQEQMSIEEALIRDQDAELEAILEQLDLQDEETNDGDHCIYSCRSTFPQQHHQTTSHSGNLCGGCGEEDTILTIPTGERFCGCCGWGPP